MKIYISLLCLFSFIYLNAQTSKNYDELSNLIEATKNTDSVYYYLTLQKKIVQQEKNFLKEAAIEYKLAKASPYGTEQIITHSLAALKLYKKLRDTVNIIKSYKAIIVTENSRGNYPKAIHFAGKAIKIATQAINNELLVDIYTVRANAYNQFSNKEKGLKDILMAKKIAQKIPNNKELLIKIYKSESFILYSNADYKESIEVIKEILNVYKSLGNSRSMVIWYNNLANTYVSCNCESFKNHREVLRKSIAMSKDINFHYGRAYAYIHLARLFKKEKQYDSAYHYLKQVDKLPIKKKKKNFIAYLNQTKGDYWATINNTENAIKSYKIAYDIWKELHVFKDQHYIATHLAKLYETKGDYKSGYIFLERSSILKDSLVNKGKIERMKEMELTAKFERQHYTDSIQVIQENKLVAVNYENEILKQKQSKIVLWFSLIGVGLLAIGAFWAFRKKRKQSVVLDNKNQEIEKALLEKQLLLKEVHHRVKNNFQIVASLLELQSKGIEDEKALELAQDGKNRVKSMALIHKRLYQNDDLLIELDDYIKSLVSDISKTYGKNKSTKVNYDIPNFKFDIDTAIPLGLIINELITNAYKYGFDNNIPVLDVSMNKIGAEEFMLVVKDNGSGLPQNFNFDKAKSLGLRLVKNLSKQLHGNTEYTYDTGCLFKVTFKDTNARMLIE